MGPLHSSEVGPIFPILDIADGSVIDPVIFSDPRWKALVMEYVEHLLFRQLCATVCRPTRTSVPDDPIQSVVLMGARLQMPRVDAERVIAAVTNYQPFGDPAVKVLVAKAMREVPGTGNGECPVTHAAGDGAAP